MVAQCYPFCLIKVQVYHEKLRPGASWCDRVASVEQKVSRLAGHSVCRIAPSIFNCQRVILQKTVEKGDFGGSYRTFEGKSDFFFIFFEKGRNRRNGCKKVMKSRV